MTTLFVFDCDGTLVDTEYLSALSFTKIIKPYGLDYTPEQMMQEFIGMIARDIVGVLNKRHGTDMPAAQIIENHAHEMHKGLPDNMRVLPESVAFIKAMAARGDVKMVVASNGQRSVIMSELRSGGILEYISENNVYVAADVARPKPFPDLFLYAAAQMGVAVKDCIVVEDSATGVRAGVAAGMRTVGYTGLSHHPEKSREALEKAGANLVITELSQLEALLS